MSAALNRRNTRMTSVLAQQLRKVSLAIGNTAVGRRDSHASLLYSAQEAADTDTQTIFDVSVTGGARRLRHAGTRSSCTHKHRYVLRARSGRSKPHAQTDTASNVQLEAQSC